MSVRPPITALQVIQDRKRGYIEIVATGAPNAHGRPLRIGSVAFTALLEPSFYGRNGEPPAPWLRRFLLRAYHAAIEDICAGRLPFPSRS